MWDASFNRWDTSGGYWGLMSKLYAEYRVIKCTAMLQWKSIPIDAPTAVNSVTGTIEPCPMNEVLKPQYYEPQTWVVLMDDDNGVTGNTGSDFNQWPAQVFNPRASIVHFQPSIQESNKKVHTVKWHCPPNILKDGSSWAAVNSGPPQNLMARSRLIIYPTRQTRMKPGYAGSSIPMLPPFTFRVKLNWLVQFRKPIDNLGGTTVGDMHDVLDPDSQPLVGEGALPEKGVKFTEIREVK